mmetsp:Transcript_32316/g.65569  ORF Transcript_32316/g.65569 Transcript_32316/m.65569 type:complete len:240 (+) Transcript_32316:111-830(+)
MKFSTASIAVVVAAALAAPVAGRNLRATARRAAEGDMGTMETTTMEPEPASPATAGVLGSTGSFGLTPEGGYPGYTGFTGSANANANGSKQKDAKQKTGNDKAAATTLPANLSDLNLKELKSLLDDVEDKDDKKILKKQIKAAEKIEQATPETQATAESGDMPAAGVGVGTGMGTSAEPGAPPIGSGPVLGQNSNALAEILAAYGSMSNANAPGMESMEESKEGDGSGDKKKKKKGKRE